MQHGFGKHLHLLRLVGAGEEGQLVAAGLGEFIRGRKQHGGSDSDLHEKSSAPYRPDAGSCLGDGKGGSIV